MGEKFLTKDIRALSLPLCSPDSQNPINLKINIKEKKREKRKKKKKKKKKKTVKWGESGEEDLSLPSKVSELIRI